MRLIAMKKPGKARQISYQSTPEIVSALDLAAARLAMTQRFGGSKLRTGHLINAVARWLGSLPDEKLREFAVPLLRKLEIEWERGDEFPESVAVGRRESPEGAEGGGAGYVGGIASARKAANPDDAKREDPATKPRRRPLRRP